MWTIPLLYDLNRCFTRWSHICLLSIHNIVFARLLAQIIRLWAHILDYPIKTIHLDNTDEFTSQTFINYCMSIRINIEHIIVHTHTQNGLTKSFIKSFQLIARPILMKTKLPTSAWGILPFTTCAWKTTKYLSFMNLWLCSIFTNCTYTMH